jgi:hypothetical protein
MRLTMCLAVRPAIAAMRARSTYGSGNIVRDSFQVVLRLNRFASKALRAGIDDFFFFSARKNFLPVRYINYRTCLMFYENIYAGWWGLRSRAVKKSVTDVLTFKALPDHLGPNRFVRGMPPRTNGSPYGHQGRQAGFALQARDTDARSVRGRASARGPLSGRPAERASLR